MLTHYSSTDGQARNETGSRKRRPPGRTAQTEKAPLIAGEPATYACFVKYSCRTVWIIESGSVHGLSWISIVASLPAML